jgi:hypothetical protein
LDEPKKNISAPQSAKKPVPLNFKKYTNSDEETELYDDVIRFRDPMPTNNLFTFHIQSKNALKGDLLNLHSDVDEDAHEVVNAFKKYTTAN